MVYIPNNDYSVKPGYYTLRGIVALLREHCSDSAAVYFIADMLE
jgi:hypothetical protein